MIHDDLATLARPIEDLRLYARNPRRGDIEAIARSLDRFGQRKPIVARSDGEVIAGNHTLEAARSLGWTEIAVVYVDDDDTTAAAFALADNRTGDLGTYDPETLAELISEVKAADEAMIADTGYDPKAIAEALAAVDARHEGATSFDSIPEQTGKEPRTQPGEIHRLGDHVVACGDATDPAFVAKAIEAGGGTIDCLWTDPPYGVDYVESREHRDGAIALRVHVSGDDLQGEDLANLIAGALAAAEPWMPEGAPFYMTAHRPRIFAEAAIAAGLDPKHELVWVKHDFVMGRSDYHYAHEKIVNGEKPHDPLEALGIMYGWKPGGAHPWFGGRTKTSVFAYPKPARNELHPTQKPVGLIAAMLANSTKPGDTVYDPFAGSGSTMIAAASLDRRAICVELDPGYCDTIRDRFEAWSGKPEKPE